MRVLGIGTYNELGFLYMRLMEEGHDVRVYIADAGAHDVLAGLVTRVDDWESQLEWIGRDGLILFEDVGQGELQERLRGDGYRVVGGSIVGDRLERERELGQRLLRECGLETAVSHAFADFDAAQRFLRERPGRYVLKFDGSDFPSDMNFVGARDDGRDVGGVLRRHARTWKDDYDSPPSFILMEYVRGVETGLGAFFNGTKFVGPINLDWEHKRFFPGDIGELTGEMGTVVTYRNANRLFDATLARLAPVLEAAGHIGYVNLNTIIDERGVWPLELTCRFGYPGFAILSALHAAPIGDFLASVARGESPAMATHDGYAVGVVLTVPPFPHHHGYEELSKGMPVLLPEDISSDERAHLHFGEVGMVEGALVTTGIVGYTLVVTGRGETVPVARDAAYRLAEKIAIPNVRYRRDIGERLVASGLADLHRWGWL